MSGHRVSWRWIGRSVAFASLVLSLVAPAKADVFEGVGPIRVPGNPAVSGEASPFPSAVRTLQQGPITELSVTIHGLRHTGPDDLDIALMKDSGQNVILMADAGGDVDISGVDLLFDDDAFFAVPRSTQITSGAYKPTIWEGFSSDALPEHLSAYTLASFDGLPASARWYLYVFDDDRAVDDGVIDSWSLDITSLQVTEFSPASAKVGATVSIGGTGFTGATQVRIGDVPVVSFAVVSDTEITAIVPEGASSDIVSVTTPVGTGWSNDFFLVRHDRRVTFSLPSGVARGSVVSVDGFRGCGHLVEIRVQRRTLGVWRTVVARNTRANGSFVVLGLDDPGRYRVVAPKVTTTSSDICLKSISRVVRAR